jgi:hypothetical protein
MQQSVYLTIGDVIIDENTPSSDLPSQPIAVLVYWPDDEKAPEIGSVIPSYAYAMEVKA